MEEIFWNYSEGSRTGLQRITMATGSGKTHAMINFIADYLIKIEEGQIAEPRNIVMTSSQKKNLPLSELKETMASKGYPHLYDKYVIFLDSYAGLIKNNYKPYMEDDIRGVITDADVLKDFFTMVSFLESNDDSKMDSYLDDKISLTEYKFRRTVKRNLRSAYRRKYDDTRCPNKDQLLSFIEEEPSWSWPPALYPQVLSSKKRVFFMSVDKFLMKNDTIVGRSFTIFDSYIVKGSIVFIDEFDASKMTMEDRLIHNNLDNLYDYLDSFEKIFKKLSNVSEQPNRLYAMSLPYMINLSEDLKDDPEYKSLSKEDKKEFLSNYLYRRSEGVRRYFKQISDRYRLDVVFKVNPEVADDRAFLFHDRRISYIAGGNRYIHIKYDESENLNDVSFFESSSGLGFVFGLFNSLRSAHRTFYHLVRLLASNYQHSQISQNVSFEDCIRTVLSEFMITGELQDPIVSEILLMSSKKQRDELRIDESFYDSGFRYYNFEDDDSHGLRSNMMMISQNITPEKVLLSVCRNAMVFGISATADLQTSLGNFDLRYLKKQLRENYYELSDEHKDILKKRFQTANSGYLDDQIHIHEVTETDGIAYSEDCWKTMFKDEFNCLSVYNLVHRSSKDTFHESRYLKAAKVFYGFILNSDITAMLSFFNKHPLDKDPDFNKTVLESIFSVLIDENKDILPEGFSVSENVVYLNKETLATEKPRLNERLAVGKKMFVITAYGTLGAGQNLQYVYNASEPTVRINDYKPSTKKDYNAIYVEKPTNIVPFYSDHGDTVQLLEHIFSLEYLFQNREISETIKYDGLRFAFLNETKRLMQIRSQCNRTRSGRLNAAGTVIQAIGRICRTNMKSSTIHIFADTGLRSIFTDFPDSYGDCLNLETRKLIEFMYTEAKDEALCSMEEAAVYDSYLAMDYINRVRSHWSDENIRRWENLREFTLRNPVNPSAESDEYDLYVKTDIETDRIFYQSEGDFSNVKIYFRQPNVPFEVVSQDSARLEELMGMDFIRELFESRGYAKTFTKGNTILSPPLFKNIYKGALGEVCGKAILGHFGIDLFNMSKDRYELFDFVTGNDVAVDFKHWSSSLFTDMDEQYPKILEKMDRAMVDTVFVINILKTGDHKFMNVKTFGDKVIIEVSYLYDPITGKYNEEAIEKIRSVC